MKISIFKLTRSPRLPRLRIRRLIEAAARREKARFREANVVIAGNRYLRDLNRIYFHKDRPTNVIAFNLGSVCEIYVAQSFAYDEYDLCFYIMHGFLHTLGYEHRRTAERVCMDKKCHDYLTHV
jgi:ssRNA-specific RNase YbeY (16S rRNA maturation enzyme)